MANLQLRHKLKYYINMADYLIIKSQQSAFIEHNLLVKKNRTYKIHSLYYKTSRNRVQNRRNSIFSKYAVAHIFG